MLVNNSTSGVRMGMQGWLDDLMEEQFTLLLSMGARECKEDGVTGNTIN